MATEDDMMQRAIQRIVRTEVARMQQRMLAVLDERLGQEVADAGRRIHAIVEPGGFSSGVERILDQADRTLKQRQAAESHPVGGCSVCGSVPLSSTPVFTNGLQPATAELLALLAEELAEAAQATMKILRHGFGSRNPLDQASLDNRAALEKELGHVQHAVNRLVADSNLQQELIDVAERQKAATIGQWLHHQPAREGREG
jgi:hypothetical protein